VCYGIGRPVLWLVPTCDVPLFVCLFVFVCMQFLEIAEAIVRNNGDPELKSNEGQEIRKFLVSAHREKKSETKKQQDIWSKVRRSIHVLKKN